MAWSDNVRCLYCDGKLPLYRKITSGQFCSAAHRKSYWQDQERLAVERLHQTHDSLRAYRSPEALEAILGKPAASEPVSVDKYYLAGELPEVDRRDVDLGDLESRLSVEEMARSAANTGNVRFAGFLTEEKPALRAWHALLAAWDTEFAQWPMSEPAILSCASEHEERTLPAANGLAVPLFHAVGLAAQIRAAAEKAQPVEFIAKLIAKVPFAIAPQTEELSRAFLETRKAAEVVAAPAAQAETVLEAEPALAAQPAVEEAPIPFTKPQSALPNISIEPAAIALHFDAPEPQPAVAAITRPVVAAITRMEPLAFTNAPRTMAARAGAAGDAKAGDLQGYVQPMELQSATGAPSKKFALAAAAPGMSLAASNGYAVFNSTGAAPAKLNAATAPSAQPLELRSEASSPSLHVASRSLDLNLRPAPGCRYDVQSQPGPIQQAVALSGAGDEISIAPAPVKQPGAQSLKLGLGITGPCELPVQSATGTNVPVGSTEMLAARNQLRIVALPNGLVKTALHPTMAGIRPLAFAAAACAPSAPQPDARGVELIYAANTPMNPVANLEPLDGSVTPQRRGFLAAFGGPQDGTHSWTHAVDFWQNAPRDLKLLAIAIPILLGLALRPSLPKVRVTAPAANTEGISKNLGDGIRAQFVNVRNTVAQRAAVALNEDFRSGLEEWQTRGDLSTGWSFDDNGFVKPGTLALYRPSLGLRDYDFEFLGLIDKKALSWVVRAKDFDNYYVVKLMVTKAGPIPTMGITRYAVIDGKAQPSVNTVAAINARPDMLYRVTMNVHEDTFLLSMQDTVIDNWSEPRLKRGGVGFFASRGEESRLRWLNITHQYDMLGRLCAYLAPYNIPTTDGSW
jgi:hypothetical protein